SSRYGDYPRRVGAGGAGEHRDRLRLSVDRSSREGGVGVATSSMGRLRVPAAPSPADRRGVDLAASPTGVAARLVRDPRGLAALVALAVLVLAAVIGPLLYEADPNALDLSRAGAPPSVDHPLG